MDDCFLNLIYIMKKNILLLSFLCNFSLLLSAQTNVEKGLQIRGEKRCVSKFGRSENI